jgi:Protein of unknown function (DUF3606)
VNQPHEVQYWCKQLDCNEHDLRGAVQAVGPMVKDVQKRLDKHE